MCSDVSMEISTYYNQFLVYTTSRKAEGLMPWCFLNTFEKLSGSAYPSRYVTSETFRLRLGVSTLPGFPLSTNSSEIVEGTRISVRTILSHLIPGSVSKTSLMRFPGSQKRHQAFGLYQA
jgi:hypothetical protein